MGRLTERAEIDKCPGIWVKEEFAREGTRTWFNGYDQGYSAINKCAGYEDLEDEGKLLKLPCAIGNTVYVLAECENIPTRLYGTLYDSNGDPGTATGYYCPYENNCPFDDEEFDDCEKSKNRTAVFEDTVESVTFREDGVWINTENCRVYSRIGVYVFLTREEAEAVLSEDMEEVMWNEAD